jgi:DNA mismatch endonuclease (patch repair protein)
MSGLPASLKQSLAIIGATKVDQQPLIRDVNCHPMGDVLTAEQRSYCMSRIRGKNTRPELMIRLGLYALGFRYRLHRRDLPGCPDLVFPKYRAVIFINGCLWHAHKCHLFQWPRTNAQFWRQKINRNRRNDLRATTQLLDKDWRVLTIWECAVRGRLRLDPETLFDRITKWLVSRQRRLHIEARDVGLRMGESAR